MKKLLLSLGLASTLALSGCATIFGDNDKTVSITTYPPGADVFYNGVEYGKTPLKLHVKDTFSPNQILIKKKGYNTVYQPILTKFQNVGFLNILFPIGFIVDAATSDMMKIVNTDVNIKLVKADADGATI